MPTMQAANTRALTISDSTNALRVGNVIVVMAHSKNGFSREVAPLLLLCSFPVNKLGMGMAALFLRLDSAS